jgi:hypothetical protein
VEGVISSDIPAPIPLKVLSGAGFAKQVRQNLEPAGFTYQNIDSKRLTVFQRHLSLPPVL